MGLVKVSDDMEQKAANHTVEEHTIYELGNALDKTVRTLKKLYKLKPGQYPLGFDGLIEETFVEVGVPPEEWESE